MNISKMLGYAAGLTWSFVALHGAAQPSLAQTLRNIGVYISTGIELEAPANLSKPFIKKTGDLKEIAQNIMNPDTQEDMLEAFQAPEGIRTYLTKRYELAKEFLRRAEEMESSIDDSLASFKQSAQAIVREAVKNMAQQIRSTRRTQAQKKALTTSPALINKLREIGATLQYDESFEDDAIFNSDALLVFADEYQKINGDLANHLWTGAYFDKRTSPAHGSLPTPQAFFDIYSQGNNQWYPPVQDSEIPPLEPHIQKTVIENGRTFIVHDSFIAKPGNVINFFVQKRDAILSIARAIDAQTKMLNNPKIWARIKESYDQALRPFWSKSLDATAQEWGFARGVSDMPPETAALFRCLYCLIEFIPSPSAIEPGEFGPAVMPPTIDRMLNNCIEKNNLDCHGWYATGDLERFLGPAGAQNVQKFLNMYANQDEPSFFTAAPIYFLPQTSPNKAVSRPASSTKPAVRPAPSKKLSPPQTVPSSLSKPMSPPSAARISPASSTPTRRTPTGSSTSSSPASSLSRSSGFDLQTFINGIAPYKAMVAEYKGRPQVTAIIGEHLLRERSVYAPRGIKIPTDPGLQSILLGLQQCICAELLNAQKITLPFSNDAQKIIVRTLIAVCSELYQGSTLENALAKIIGENLLGRQSTASRSSPASSKTGRTPDVLVIPSTVLNQEALQALNTAENLELLDAQRDAIEAISESQPADIISIYEALVQSPDNPYILLLQSFFNQTNVKQIIQGHGKKGSQSVRMLALIAVVATHQTQFPGTRDMITSQDFVNSSASSFEALVQALLAGTPCAAAVKDLFPAAFK